MLPNLSACGKFNPEKCDSPADIGVPFLLQFICDITICTEMEIWALVVLNIEHIIFVDRSLIWGTRKKQKNPAPCATILKQMSNNLEAAERKVQRRIRFVTTEMLRIKWSLKPSTHCRACPLAEPSSHLRV